jgi:hypothetical protein
MHPSIRREMNFTLSVYRREDTAWGSLLNNGSFTGMISTLVKGEADLIGTSLTMMPERHLGVDYLECS